MEYPEYRPRRLRQNPNFRRLIRETKLTVDDLIYPLFVVPGTGVKDPVPSMPGVYRLSVDKLVEEVREVASLGIPAIILFGVPESKDEVGSGAYAEDGIVQRAVRAIKDGGTDIIIITDVCMCEYTSHGHCGLVKNGDVDNDSTLELLARTALSQVQAGADMVAPSDMMDGRVARIRSELDEHGYTHVPIMAYSAKYCSSFYGPFRDAADSAPQFGDRQAYQMDPANAEEAIREVALDIMEGADIVMVKPALAFLDIIHRVKLEFDRPVAAYNVSGEYSMIKAASEKGWLDEKRTMMEILTAIKRAGADMILTYFAKDVAKLLGA